MAADDKHATLYRRPNAKLMEDGTPRNIAEAYKRIPVSQRSQYYVEYQDKVYEGEDVEKLPR
ncbi:MAG: hypothetical protein JWN71_1331 [Xanthobacteraceae bacterium]|jgi:hypothetical protein|nr:hypothetical protein [Xanthobacteraceae bacterium]